ncbi:uncharacterized protein SAPINGB_P006089 [Magnusiomyces paraingens]|uniref:Glycosyl transferase family 25 domain-containing protein n=1 Tax=Magnusiomyces paraingens TaxID=2606893 RepID=A0A5E8C369_9ASCO|nr:uncharacterized protein SAPINGB_P006089 [Saprochaete ingens]VVT58204.1 unnamed protein product [Saprochaete ingens]
MPPIISRFRSFHKIGLLAAVFIFLIVGILCSNTFTTKTLKDDDLFSSPTAVPLDAPDSNSKFENLHSDNDNDNDDHDDDAHAQDVVGLANSTLGFQKILYLNVPDRYNLDDTITMQSALSGIKPEQFIGVNIKTLKEEGLPPSSRPEPMIAGVKACYRSHANMWRKMIDEGWETMLILEADAVWDINIRQIFYHFGQGLEQLMKKRNILEKGEHATENDPYLSKHWDVIQFGGCYANERRKDVSVQYYDPYAPSGVHFFGDLIKNNRRVVRWQAGEVCTVSYAISRAGAMKLLLRTAIDMNEPVDLILAIMIESGGLTSYSVYPVMFDQWQYKSTLGLESKNSDIRGPEDMEGGNNNNKQDKEETRNLWKGLHETLDVWTSRFPENSRFKKNVLNNLKSYIFDKKKIFEAEIEKSIEEENESNND